MVRAPQSREGVVDALTEELALSILRGDLPREARLPSVRELSRAHGVNVSTVQRVLARLEESGLVVAHPRSGVEVLDPARHASTRVLPILLRHPRANRELAIAVLRDALETRRLLARHVTRSLATLPHSRYGAALEAAVEAFAVACEEAPRNLRHVAETENEILRTVLIAAGRPTVLAIANDMGTIVASSEVVLETLYRETAGQVAAWRTFAGMLAKGEAGETFAFIEPMLEAIDLGLVRAFARSLGVPEEPGPHEEKPSRKRPGRAPGKPRRKKR